MRFALMLVIFVIVGVTLTGTLLTILLTAPISGQQVGDLFGWIAAAGFALALIISYFIAGYILKHTSGIS